MCRLALRITKVTSRFAGGFIGKDKSNSSGLSRLARFNRCSFCGLSAHIFLNNCGSLGGRDLQLLQLLRFARCAPCVACPRHLGTCSQLYGQIRRGSRALELFQKRRLGIARIASAIRIFLEFCHSIFSADGVNPKRICQAGLARCFFDGREEIAFPACSLSRRAILSRRVIFARSESSASCSRKARVRSRNCDCVLLKAVSAICRALLIVPDMMNSDFENVSNSYRRRDLPLRHFVL
uniref:Uncharacterized protein n=1 Tax=Cereibacter sphaeroides (strain ATCC 17025 / ATH 2.4.3) TaxID=349102 RepID=A4X0H4_CERS5